MMNLSAPARGGQVSKGKDGKNGQYLVLTFGRCHWLCQAAE
jgi:hypothetical protein